MLTRLFSPTVKTHHHSRLLSTPSNHAGPVKYVKPSPTGLNLPRRVFTPEQLIQIYDYAYKKRLEAPDSAPRVKLWLREKLGPQLNVNWSSQAGQRYHDAKNRALVKAKIPPVGTHFEVTHSATSTTAPNTSLFAIIPLAGTQFKVVVGDKVIANHIAGEINEQVRLDNILMIGSQSRTVVGRPIVPGATVLARIEQQVLEEKVLAFYKREKKWSQNVRGSRRHVTVLRIEAIHGGPTFENPHEKKVEDVAKMM